MTAQAEIRRNQEQPSLQDRLVTVANAHAGAVLEGKMELDELAFRVPAVFSRDGRFGDHKEEWADLDANVGHLVEGLGREDVEQFGNLDALQSAIYTNSLPDDKVPLATAFLVQSVDLFKRTLDDNPAAIGSNAEYFAKKVEQAEGYYGNKLDRIASEQGSIATSQVVSHN